MKNDDRLLGRALAGAIALHAAAAALAGTVPLAGTRPVASRLVTPRGAPPERSLRVVLQEVEPMENTEPAAQIAWAVAPRREAVPRASPVPRSEPLPPVPAAAPEAATAAGEEIRDNTIEDASAEPGAADGGATEEGAGEEGVAAVGSADPGPPDPGLPSPVAPAAAGPSTPSFAISPAIRSPSGEDPAPDLIHPFQSFVGARLKRLVQAKYRSRGISVENAVTLRVAMNASGEMRILSIVSGDPILEDLIREAASETRWPAPPSALGREVVLPFLIHFRVD